MSRFKDWINSNITLHSHDSRKEDFLNGLTHFIGIILSLTGLILLIFRESSSNSMKAATIVYGITMLLLFTASTIYHWLKDPFLKRIGRILDHCNIYLLIAGTYTPLAFFIGGRDGIFIISTEWFLTVVGIVFTMVFWGKLKPLHVVFYLVMGWMIVIIWKSIKSTVPLNYLKLTLAGGITYTLGVLVYGLKKFPFYHAIWHLFVVGGATFMFLGIYRYLI